jgi:ADP-ribosylglycohydrolase
MIISKINAYKENCNPYNKVNYTHICKDISGQNPEKLNSELYDIAKLNKMSICFNGINKIMKKYPKHTEHNYEGCLIGGAIGDALGAPVEFMSLNEIKKEYGEDGIQDLEIDEYGEAEFTDDTQMTLFTIDGLLKEFGNNFNVKKFPKLRTIFESYKLWLATQNYPAPYSTKNEGWLSNLSGLYRRKSPGETCISSIKSNKIGTISNPQNNSKGCGGVMRVAPVGLLYYKNPENAFKVGADIAALTHGHPSGYLPAGVLSSIIAYIVQGEDIYSSVTKSVDILKKYENHEETLNSIEKAIYFAKTDIKETEVLDKIGWGWTGEEAIAIAIYSALKYPDNFEKAVKTSVNHSGDSDSTGAITGNIVGAYCGINGINNNWTSKIQDFKSLKRVSQDLFNIGKLDKEIIEQYPYHPGHIPRWYSAANPYKAPQKIGSVRFSDEDEEKMKTMSDEEKLNYKKMLIKNNKYYI